MFPTNEIQHQTVDSGARNSIEDLRVEILKLKKRVTGLEKKVKEQEPENVTRS